MIPNDCAFIYVPGLILDVEWKKKKNVALGQDDATTSLPPFECSSKS